MSASAAELQGRLQERPSQQSLHGVRQLTETLQKLNRITVLILHDRPVFATAAQRNKGDMFPPAEIYSGLHRQSEIGFTVRHMNEKLAAFIPRHAQSGGDDGLP